MREVKIPVISAVLASAWIVAGCAASPEVKAPPPAGPKLRVAVAKFENKTTYGARLGTAASDILVTELARTERFVLIERAELERLLTEQKLGLTGAVDPATAAQMGKILGAAAMVVGSVSQFGVKTEGSDLLITASKRQIAEATVDARIIDVETARILHAETGTGEAKTTSGTFLGLGSSASYDEALEGKALRAAIVGLAEGIVAQLGQIPWRCHVADVEGRDIYLDAGARSGLQVGQLLEVVRRGAEIKSPDTGIVIGHKEKTLGTAQVMRHFAQDGAIAQMQSGGPPARGDICRLAGTP
jgi:curli biogenesis system outer membrane secretion channel CsgG